MPINLPASFASYIGMQNVPQPWLLVEIQFPSGTVYWSSNTETQWNGQTWEGNRLSGSPSLTSSVLDHFNKNMDDVSFTITNFANDGSQNFPFQGIDASAIVEGSLVIVYLYSPGMNTAGGSIPADAGEVWRGRIRRPTYDGTMSAKKVTLGASYIFDILNIDFPQITLPTAGFATLVTEKNIDSNAGGYWIPMFYGAGGPLKLRPPIYRSELAGQWNYNNCIVSGCAAALPFQDSDMLGAAFDATLAATEITWRPGGPDTPAPHNPTQFPDLTSHPNVAYFFCYFATSNVDKSTFSDVGPQNIKASFQNGRPLISTGLPSANGPLILQDILCDPIWGLGIAPSDFGDISAAEDYTSTRYQNCVRLVAQTPLINIIQGLLGENHCQMAFYNGGIQLTARTTSETPVATFATFDSPYAQGGGAYRKITGDIITSATELDATQLANSITATYRNADYQAKRPIQVYDPVAVARAGLTNQAFVNEDVDHLGLYMEDQVSISAAIRLREYQAANFQIVFTSPVYEACDVAEGELITVYSPDIFNNGSNNVFRVITRELSIDVNSMPQITLTCQIYLSAVYDDTTTGTNVDAMRNGNAVPNIGRPPDVTPVSLLLEDVETVTGEGKMADITATFTWPTYDPSAMNAAGDYQEDPRNVCQIWANYVDQDPSKAVMVGQVNYPSTAIPFQFDYKKSESVQAWFVAIGPNGGMSPLGYIPNPSLTGVLSANLSATAASCTLDTGDGANFANGDYVYLEAEIALITTVVGDTLNFAVDGSGNRLAQFSTESIAHPAGVAIYVAQQSYPSLTVSLNPPKFTYPDVPDFRVLQRQQDIKTDWKQAAANVDYYLLYYSTTSGQLSSATPAWYTTDPENPPAGVTLVELKALHYLISQEDVPNGVTAYCQIAATNGKRNYSAALSAVESNNSSGVVTGIPTAAPDNPASGVITQGSITDLNNKSIQIQFGPIYADAADHTKTFADVTSEGLILEFYRTSLGSSSDTLKLTYPVEDTTQTNVTAIFSFTVGDDWTWYRTANYGGQGKDWSATETVAFVAGGFSLNPSTLTISLNIVAQDAHHSQGTATVQQPSSGAPVLLKDLVEMKQVPTAYGGDNILHKVDSKELTTNLAWSTLGASNSWTFEVKHPAGSQGITIEIQVVAHGGLTETISTTLDARGDSTGDNSTANWINSASAATAAQAGLDVEINEKKVRFKWAVPQHLTGTPDAVPASISQYGVLVRDGSGTTYIDLDTAAPYTNSTSPLEHIVLDNHLHHGWKRKELPADFLSNGFEFAVRAYNDVGGVLTAGPYSDYSNVYTVAGDIVYNDDAEANWIASTGAATAVQAGIEVVINAKHLHITWAQPQDMSDGSGVPQSVFGYDVQIVDGATGTWIDPRSYSSGVYATSSSIIPINVTDNSFKHGWFKSELPTAFATNGFKVAVRAYNLVNGIPTVGPWTGYSGTFSLTGDPLTAIDSSVPGTPPAPLVTEGYGDVTAHCQPPSTGVNSILEWQIAYTDGGVPTTADPPVVTGGGTFVDYQTQAPGVKKWVIAGASAVVYTFYCRCRNSTFPSSGGPGSNGWGAWSSGATIFSTGRPSQDEIASSVPTLLCGSSGSSTLWNSSAGTPQGVNGATSVGGTTSSTQLCGFQLSFDGVNNVLVAYVPVQSTGVSVTTLRYQQYKQSTGALEIDQNFGSAENPSVSIIAPTAYIPWLTIEMRNKNRNTNADDGWSFGPIGSPGEWSYYAPGTQNSGSPTVTYNPGSNPPPNPSIFAPANFPEIYPLH